MPIPENWNKTIKHAYTPFTWTEIGNVDHWFHNNKDFTGTGNVTDYFLPLHSHSRSFDAHFVFF